ncbi:hypothetical protein ACODT3_44165 [Streptomyces sp. 4.24]|uniref:hypothetical protein n=1 Tax=Streptomyces tritrimontium TaxID=3406573 RepID=UPI003BB6431D
MTPEPDAARCPRCRGSVGTRPARSRLHHDRTTPICTPCATDEALRDAAHLPPIPPTDWPLTN